jgi:hypothetical protein
MTQSGKPLFYLQIVARLSEKSDACTSVQLLVGYHPAHHHRRGVKW